jgi:superfamily II DNA or RNA helicase
VQAPTGFGKTVTFIEIVKRAITRCGCVLILTDRTKLYDQTISVFKAQGVQTTGINPNTKESPTGGVIVAMVQTLRRRLHTCAFKPTLVIVDEAHESTFTPIIEHFNTYTLGFTATPCIKTHKHLAKTYSYVVQGPQVKELIQQSYLTPPKSYAMEAESPKGIKITGGEYNNAELFAFFDKPKLYEGVKKAWEEKANGKQTLMFCSNIEHAEKTALQFGDLARVIHSRMSEKESTTLLQQHEHRVFPILINVGILIKGYDNPYLECVVINLKTKSLSKWIQMLGRGGRVAPNKNEFIIIDMGENFLEHGLWQMDRNWSLTPPRKKATGASPVRKCVCGAMLSSTAKNCSYCGHVFPPPKVQEHTGILREVLPQKQGIKASVASVEQLIEAENRKVLKPQYVWRVCRARGLIEAYAEYKGYKGGWIYHQNKQQNNNYRDLII